MGCIYQIRNIFNNKIYIGSTTNFRKRKQCHLDRLRSNTHHCQHLQNAFNKYGEDNFVFEKLDDNIKTDFLLESEQWWIDQYKNLYNTSKVAGTRLGIPQTEKTKQKISKTKTGIKRPEHIVLKISQAKEKPVNQIDIISGTIINTWPSATKAANTLNINNKHITNVCRGIRKSHGGYKWEYASYDKQVS